MDKIKQFLFKNTSTGQTIAKNTLWLFVGEIGGRLARFALIVFAARMLGAGQWGLFTYALSIASIFTFVSDWGFNALITRFLSQEPSVNSKGIISTILYTKTVLSIVGFLATIIVGAKISTVQEANYLIFITASIVLFDGLRDFMVSINRATEKMEREALVKIITNLIIFVVGIVGLVLIPKIKTMALAYATGTGAGLLIAFYFVRTIILKNATAFSWKSCKNIFLMAWPFAILSATTIVISNMDMLALGKWSTPEIIGIYASTQRTVQLFHIIPSFFSFALFPQLSRLVQTNKEKFRDMAKYATSLIFLVVVPIILIGIVIAGPVLSFLFGAFYIKGSMAFSILLCSLPFVFLHILFTNILIAQNKQRTIILANVLGVVFGLIAIVSLVPSYSIVGAAISMVVAQAAVAVTLWIIIRNDVPFLHSLNDSKNILFAGLIMAIAAIGLQYILHSFIITILLSLAAYASLLYITKDKSFMKIIKVFT